MARAKKGDAATGRAVVYTRFSPRPDAAGSESCEIQKAYCEELAHKKGIEIRAFFDDPDRSGSDEYREKLWAAIDALKKGDILLVYKRDRLARNVYLSECINRAVLKKGCSIVAVTGDVEGEGPEQQLVRTVVAAMAEYERKIISRRTSDAMKAKQRAGRRMSNRVPYGWHVSESDEHALEKDDDEQKTLVKMLEIWERKHSYAAIVRELNAIGSRKRNGTAWESSTVRGIILRET